MTAREKRIKQLTERINKFVEEVSWFLTHLAIFWSVIQLHLFKIYCRY